MSLAHSPCSQIFFYAEETDFESTSRFRSRFEGFMQKCKTTVLNILISGNIDDLGSIVRGIIDSTSAVVISDQGGAAQVVADVLRLAKDSKLCVFSGLSPHKK